MSLSEDLQRFDQEERQAFVRLHEADPKKKIEQLIGEVADAFRIQWFALLRSNGNDVSDLREKPSSTNE